MLEQFIKEIQDKYNSKGDKIVLGKAKLNNQVVPEAEVSVPLKTLNRHGLIAGATGTGKTKSLQILAEHLSAKGVPSLVMDIKGDLSGLAQPGDAANQHIQDRHQKLQIPYQPTALPVELMTISNDKGLPLRATVSEFGPILFSKILELNETQEGIMSIIFKFCDDEALPLVDLEDIRKVLQYLKDTDEGKLELKQEYGTISSASMGAILRKIVTLEQQGANQFFGEPSFDVNDLLKTKDQLGVISVVRLTDIQSKPNLFSTFMLSLLSEIYATLPEEGDSGQPKLVVFIDEAHLVFKEASKTLLDQIETMVKLIRSKGVGLFFITQVPGDIPEGVLSQLGLKIQHALRGFTAKDRKQIKQAVENYPTSQYYQADELITQLGIGEAFVTALNEKGIPTPLAHTYLRAPLSRMDVLTDTEMNNIINQSDLVKKYKQEVNKESAYEILGKKIELAQEDANLPTKPTTPRSTRQTSEKSLFETITGNTMVRQMGRTFMREITRSLLGALKK